MPLMQMLAMRQQSANNFGNFFSFQSEICVYTVFPIPDDNLLINFRNPRNNKKTEEQEKMLMAMGGVQRMEPKANHANQVNLRKIFEDDMGKANGPLFPQMPTQKAVYLDEIERQ